jgi:hypothetical protein
VDHDKGTDLAPSPSAPDVYWPTTFPHAADLDGDGDDELLIENVANEVGDIDGMGSWDYERAWLGGGGEIGWPSAWTDLVDTYGTDSILALTMDADLDGDGLVDLALLDTTGVRVWGWDGAALAETASTDIAWAASATDLDTRRWMGAADFDADGDSDLFLALRDEAAVQVLLNDGAGGFSLGDRISVDADLADADGTTASDLTGDGRLDVWSLTGPSSFGLLSAWRLVDGAFDALPTQTIAPTDRVTPRDIDADGVRDLVVGEDDRVYVYWGVPEVVTVDCE